MHIVVQVSMANNSQEVRVGHCKKDKTDTYIGRNANSDGMLNVSPLNDGWLGNPYTVSKFGRERCLELFEQTFARMIAVSPAFWEYLTQLAGDTLGCWCHRVGEDEPSCHGDIIARWVNSYEHFQNGSNECPMEVLSHGLLVGWNKVSAVELTIDEAMAITLTSGERFIAEDMWPVVSKVCSVDSLDAIELVPERARD